MQVSFLFVPFFAIGQRISVDLKVRTKVDGRFSRTFHVSREYDYHTFGTGIYFAEQVTSGLTDLFVSLCDMLNREGYSRYSELLRGKLFDLNAIKRSTEGRPHESAFAIMLELYELGQVWQWQDS